MSTKIIITLTGLLLAVTGLYMLKNMPSTPETQPVKHASPSATLANPASVFCIEHGGTLTMKTNSVGEYGECSFPSGETCEEWALFRGECTVAGVTAPTH
ncbi:MAG: DUF333 domain-containing protein [Minisyncoccia bacterium]